MPNRNIQPQTISVIQIPQHHQPQIFQMPIQMPIQQISHPQQPQYIILQPQPIIEQPTQPIILNFPAFLAPSSSGGLSLPSQQQNIGLQPSSHQNPPFFVTNTSTTEMIPQPISSSVHPVITLPNFYNASS